MKILFLGTGAADWPQERSDDMKEFRRLSSVLIDDILLIDPGPQVVEALKEFGKEPSKIRYIINTHKHRDHFCLQTVKTLEDMNAELIEFSNGDEKVIGGYTISAYSGNHSDNYDTVHYIIADSNRTVFYGLDGAWLMYDEVQAIKKQKPDFAVFDATIGEIDGDYRIFEHNNLNMVLEMQKTLQSYIGRFCISHMARTLHTDHETLAEKMKEHNILVAFDGLETEI